MMRIGKDIGFGAEVIGRFAEARQHILEEHLKTLLGKRQAGGQREHALLDFRVEPLQRPPRRFRDLATARWGRAGHMHPILHTENPVTLTTATRKIR